MIQEKIYLERFPFLEKNERCVLSSVFDEKFFAYVNTLNTPGLGYTDFEDKKGWIVLGSESWIKGADQAEQYCKDNDLEYEVLWGMPHHLFLAKLSAAEGLVYLPKGGDTCPRMVIEAKLLGCELVLNEYVQHKDEEWFTGTKQKTLEYLSDRGNVFWNGVYEKTNLQKKMPNICLFC